MNVQKSLFRSLLRLGVDMIYPQRYVRSVTDSGDLVFGVLEVQGPQMYVLVASYLMEDGKLVPDPEIVIHVSPLDRKATVFTCQWVNDKEIASTGLDRRVFKWLQMQFERGHHFRQPPPSDTTNVLPFTRNGGHYVHPL
jgi:hypothetical protein